MIETRAPGKLYIAGEYAVVDPGQPAVLIAVDRYLAVRLVEATGASGVGRVHSSEYARGPLVWMHSGDGPGITVEHEQHDYVIAAIRTIEELRAERGVAPAYFDLHVDSQLDHESGRKFGLGSSAAVTVAVIAALDRFYGLALSHAERFQLALLATIEVSEKSSGGDLAASTFGGWIRYTSPDRTAVRAHRGAHGVSATLASDVWHGCGIRRLPTPDSLHLLVGWTGSPASTELLVHGVRHPGPRPEAPYDAFRDDSRACVEDLVANLEDDQAGALDVIRRARRILQRLGAASGIRIETDQLRDLCDIAERHGAAGKPSGAGGGDCGVVLADSAAPSAGILREWEDHGIRRLGLSVHPAEGDPGEL